ncbi:Metallo-dependent hydrolase [Rickenella mellea]|uniref:urease n=1 Tax=Rickenella mellea TaxID=50990 RepID=A0A4Y7PJ73_9AGAM|nr:Metallo-dependent hydrolase [Rickenella mellea]
MTLVERVGGYGESGCCGLKFHEDWGSTPAAIKNCLDVGDKYDVEARFAASEGRTIHTYHTEGAGEGHAPDIVVVFEHENVLPSSTNPTRPYAQNSLDEHLDMLIIRAENVAAQDALRDIGAISMISSDSQAMGLVGLLSDLGDKDGVDNGRVKRYVAKYNLNPAITHGINNFGAKQAMVLMNKSGVIVCAKMGYADASIPTVQPVRPQQIGAAFVPSITIVSGAVASYGLAKRAEPVRRCRTLKKKDMKWSNATPKMKDDPESYYVGADGVKMDFLSRSTAIDDKV